MSFFIGDTVVVGGRDCNSSAQGFVGKIVKLPGEPGPHQDYYKVKNSEQHWFCPERHLTLVTPKHANHISQKDKGVVADGV